MPTSPLPSCLAVQSWAVTQHIYALIASCVEWGQGWGAVNKVGRNSYRRCEDLMICYKL